jgi:hypothetical protein
MIEAGEVGAVCTIVDKAAAVLKRIAERAGLLVMKSRRSAARRSGGV